jgi:hypothetical protein
MPEVLGIQILDCWYLLRLWGELFERLFDDGLSTYSVCSIV